MTLRPQLSSDILDATSALLLVSEVGTGVVVRMNRAAEELTGFTRDAVIGRPLWDVVSLQHREMLQRTLGDPDSEGLPESFESSVGRTAGGPRRVVWSSRFLTDDDGVRAHVVMTGFDTSSAAGSGGLLSHLMGAAGSTAMISTDLVGRVTYCSPGAEVMLGIRAEPLLGRPMPPAVFDLSELRSRASELGVRPDLGVLTARMSADRLHAGGENLLQVRDWTVTCTDGTRLIVSVAVYLVRDADGREVGYVGIAHDVTEKHRTNRIVADALVAGEQAVERLQELDLAKTEFISTVSHELRTPLSSIVGCTELLQDGLAGELSPSQLKLLATVERNCGRLVALADDLGTVARTDAGFLDLELAELDLRDVVSNAREALQTVLLDRSLETFLELPAGPLIINGDRAQLARVVLNLLNNAVKFTDDGGTITCRLSRAGPDAVLEVSDNGVGIPRAEQRDLFTRFFRSSASHDRETQGSGLGLSIVSSIVQQHGGQISVESDHLQGSAFTVRIPLVPPSVTGQAA